LAKKMPIENRSTPPKGIKTGFSKSMIRKSGNRFSEKIMLHQHARAPIDSI
jgi:hypothetical protein